MPTTPQSYIGRFAPTPSGDLHLGTLVAALASWLRARQHGGQWLIRIDDIDPPRELPGSSERILAGLQACGLAPDAPPLHQSTRHAAYRAALDTLRAQGLVFPCWCSRADLAATNACHRDGHCLRGRDPGRPPALRLKTPADDIHFDDLVRGPVHQNVRDAVGDFVLRRADGTWSYHLACAVDEAHLGVTEVIRGHDLLPSTARQILLLRRLHLAVPRYGHIPLVTDGQGRKLAKSNHNTQLDLSDPEAALQQALAHLDCRPARAASHDVATTLAAAGRLFRLRAA